jgi:hypothetical protein
VANTPISQHGYSHAPVAGRRPPASGTEDSLVAPQSARSWARRFKDPQDVTWWVHLMRPGVESVVVGPGRLQAVMLRFQNGISAHSRYLHPVPPDWRECDDLTLWHYCEQAMQ